MKKILFSLLALSMAGAAFAKLPPLSDEAKAKADEAKQKTAWNDKVSAYQLCKSQDKVAAQYLKKQNKKPAAASAYASGTAAPAPCADPGPFVLASAAPAPGAPAAAAPAAAPAAAGAKPAASAPAAAPATAVKTASASAPAPAKK